jgi:hypothetical protein
VHGADIPLSWLADHHNGNPPPSSVPAVRDTAVISLAAYLPYWSCSKLLRQRLRHGQRKQLTIRDAHELGFTILHRNELRDSQRVAHELGVAVLHRNELGVKVVFRNKLIDIERISHHVRHTHRHTKLFRVAVA